MKYKNILNDVLAVTMEQYHIEVLVSGDIAKSKEILQRFVAQVIKIIFIKTIMCVCVFANEVKIKYTK